MTNETEGLIQEISINQVLVSILEEHKKLTVPTAKFAEAAKTDKELVIDYDETGPSFTFSLRDKSGSSN
jgi:hypothetical protein